MPAARLEKLNPQQRRAVEHGGLPLGAAGSLLIIAGAGSGKTATLAHRVAYLIEHGADPRRIMLLTFSPRRGGDDAAGRPHLRRVHARKGRYGWRLG